MFFDSVVIYCNVQCEIKAQINYSPYGYLIMQKKTMKYYPLLY